MWRTQIKMFEREVAIKTLPREVARVVANRGWISGDDDATMLIHWKESATTKTAPFCRNRLGAGGGGPQDLSLVGRDAKTAPAASVSGLGARSSLRACNPKAPARGPRDFCYGLLGSEMLEW